jgi:hypothetical protein
MYSLECTYELVNSDSSVFLLLPLLLLRSLLRLDCSAEVWGCLEPGLQHSAHMLLLPLPPLLLRPNCSAETHASDAGAPYFRCARAGSAS